MKEKIIPAVIAVLVFCGGFYAHLHTDGYKFKASHLPANTYINGVDCSEMSKDEAIRALTNKWNSHKIVVKRGGNSVATFALDKIQYDIGDDIDGLIGTNFYRVLKNHSGTKKKEHVIKMTPLNPEVLDKAVLGHKFLDIPYTVKTKNAYVNMDNTKFRVVKEVYGDNVDKDKVLATIKAGIPDGKFSMKFDPKKYKDLPEIKKGDKVLKEEIKFDKKHYTQKFIYEKYNGTYRITPKDIKKMRPVDKDGNATINKKEIEKFMKDTLAWKVNTQYFDRKFKTTGGKTIMTSGSYGYALDKKKEAEQLAKDLEANKDFTRKPVYAHKAYYTGKGKSDLGGDYVEVSLGAQTLWLYKKGKCIMSTSVTTGRDESPTERGCYYFEYKTRNATLTGPDYSNDVSYWMPFNGDQGCHDASWRHDFGSSAYHVSGSHGCVNMPTYEAARLYKEVEKGFPVIVY